MRTRPSAILLFGPTAVGKTELALSVFGERAEVISADSMQVYRGMDIGTAKPSAATRLLLPHHLIDLRNPDEQYTVGDFVRAAEALVSQIEARGRIPLVIGGTAYYLRHLVFGLPDTPPSDPGVRRDLILESKRIGVAALYERLRGLDPEAAAAIGRGDRYRVVRALEIVQATGRPLSDLRASNTTRTDIRFRLIGLDRERSDLYGRISRRVDAMVQMGLVDEVRKLFAAGYRQTDPGMRGIGYREFVRMRNSGCTTLSQTIEAIKGDSRRYAKRQLTFFRSFPDVLWIRPHETDLLRREVERFLSSKSPNPPIPG